MTKEKAIRKIRELAAKNGGKVSFDLFIKEAGIPEQRLRKAPWFPGWNNLVKESGLSTNQFSVARTSDEDIAAAVADLIMRLNKWPTEDEFVREKRVNPAFPHLSVIRRAKKSGKLRLLLEDCRVDDETCVIVRDIAKSLPVAANGDEADDSDTSARVQGFVYMLRNNRRYKIGFTKSPVRRFREVRLELPDETIRVHSIETDDPMRIEGYWHKRFASKQIRDSEWFELDANDIRAFKRRDYQ